MIEITTGIIGLIAAIVGQLVALVWYAARFSARMDRVEEILTKLSTTEEADSKTLHEIDKKLDDHERRLTRIEEVMR